MEFNKELRQTRITAPKKTKFNLSHSVKQSFKMGDLVPFTAFETLPGDVYKMNIQDFLRAQPMIAPLMDTFNVLVTMFFVPNRILWDGWEDFIVDKESDPPRELPYITMTDIPVSTGKGSIGNYLGLPPNINGTHNVSAFPLAAYYKIFNDYFMDQNLQTELDTNLVDGDNTGGIWSYIGKPLKRAWARDYFTAALPFAQKGEAVTLPLTDNDIVYVDYVDTDTPPIIRGSSTNQPISNADVGSQSGGFLRNLASGLNVKIDPNMSLFVDLNLEAVTVSTLRRAYKLQEWLERNARGGTRYIESMKIHFGQESSDSRLQRAEYIAGYNSNFVISEVLSTTETINTAVAGEPTVNPVGQMAGHGISAGSSKQFNYKTEEHGWIIGIINVQPKNSYYQGIPRHFSRTSFLDFAWPTFAHIGEQTILGKEIFTNGDASDNEEWGYLPRYTEYKMMNNRIAGDFADNLNYWTTAEDYTAKPELNSDFITCNPRRDYFAVTDPNEDTILSKINIGIHAWRALPMYSDPKM